MVVQAELKDDGTSTLRQERNTNSASLSPSPTTPPPHQSHTTNTKKYGSPEPNARMGDGDPMSGTTPGSFGLTTFVVPDFDAQLFVDEICSQAVEVDELDFLLDDLGTLQDDLDDAIEKVDQMDSAVGKRIERSRIDNERLSKELRTIAQDQNRVQEKVARQFRTLERKFGRASESAIGIGSRLEHLDEVKNRAAHAKQLLHYFTEFAYEPEITSSLFTDFPRTLTEAAPYIHDLESVTLDLTVPGLEQGVKRVEKMSGRILNGLLDEFDRAAADNDTSKMRSCADAVLENFRHKQGPENLFQRFVYHSLNPLLAARERSIGFRNTALRDNLAHLFTQIRSVVRTTHVVVAKVFPHHSDEIFALLVTRLFNDSVFGLQPMLQEFLFPEHRGGELAHNEFLQILFTAHHETEVLVEELTRGLQASHQVKTDENRAKIERVEEPQTRLFSSGKASQDLERAADMKRQMLRFDIDVIRKQVSAVFEPLTESYAEREEQLFAQRMSKKLFATMPFEFVRVVIPELKPPPGIDKPPSRSQTSLDNQTRESLSGRARAPSSPGDNLSWMDSAAFRSLYTQEPLAAIRRLLLQIASTEEDFRVETMVEKTLDLKPSWREDILSLPLPALARALEQSNRSWRLEDLDDIAAGAPPAPREDTFEGIFYDLRGIPGQAIRWGFEAHKRCVDLLGPSQDDIKDSNSTSSRNPTESIVLAIADDYRAFYDSAQRLFQKLCDRFFVAMLVPILQVVHTQIPEISQFREADGSSMLKALAEEMELFDDHDQAYVVGSSPVVHRLQVLPALAHGNTSVKALVAAITKRSKQSERLHSIVPESAIELYLITSQTVEELIEQILFYWRDLIYPSLSKSPNAVSVCQAFLNNRLNLCESLLADGLDTILNLASAQTQACALALWDKFDYAPKEGVEVQYDRNTTWCLACVDLLSVYADRISRLSNQDARQIGLLRLSYLGRDILLGTLRRAKVSVNGSFTLVQDIGVLSKVFTTNPFCSSISDVTETWDELRLISQLFIVQPANLQELISDREGGLSHVRPRLLYECISRRSDFRTSFGGKASWVKTLFAKST